MYRDFFRLGFFYEAITEAQLALFLKRYGWNYMVHDIKKIDPTDPCLFSFCFTSHKSILVDVKLNSNLRVWFAVKNMVHQFHQQFMVKSPYIVTDEQLTSIATDLATSTVIPPAQLINLYKSNALREEKSLVAEFDVTQDIAKHAMSMLQHYYIDNPDRDEFVAGLVEM